MIINDQYNRPSKLQEIFDEFRSLETQNDRILFFDNPENISKMSEFDIKIENCKKAHIAVWDKAFSKRPWAGLQQEI